MIALLSEPGWVKHDAEDDDSEPEQVDRHAKKTTQRLKTASSLTSFQDRVMSVPVVFRRQWSLAPIAGAFLLGIGSAFICQLLFRQRK